MTSIVRAKRLHADGGPESDMSPWGPVADDVVEGDPKARRRLDHNEPRPGGVTPERAYGKQPRIPVV